MNFPFWKTISSHFYDPVKSISVGFSIQKALEFTEKIVQIFQMSVTTWQAVWSWTKVVKMSFSEWFLHKSPSKFPLAWLKAWLLIILKLKRPKNIIPNWILCGSSDLTSEHHDVFLRSDLFHRNESVFQTKLFVPQQARLFLIFWYNHYISTVCRFGGKLVPKIPFLYDGDSDLHQPYFCLLHHWREQSLNRTI